ncbi:MAG: cation:proton antiporter [Verrucomicrobiales bacterium]|nr:cation:proton antiporter [Verrucomicrobiales bacterium]
MEELICLAALLVFVYGLVSALAARSPITAPMVFVAVGVLASPLAFDLFEAEVDSEGVQLIAEITLILILFSDASTIDLRRLGKDFGTPLRLLAIGLPLTMILGTLVALPLFPGISPWWIALMAFVLSPTDAALGQAVVTSERVPPPVRDAIGVESGLNDGIALPPILACLAAVAAAPGTRLDFSYWSHFALKQMAYGPLAGAVVGWGGGLLIDQCARRRWMAPVFQRLASISLAILSYSLAEQLGGNGFIAAFFGGLMLGARTPVVRERIQEFGEAEGQQLSLFVFLVFGMVMVPAIWRYWDAAAWVYALLSLTLIRMLPVALCLWGSQLSLPTVGFIGWFGPRGIASILYTLMVLGKVGPAGHERVFSVIGLTVLISVLLHGLSAVPLSTWYGRHAWRKTGNATDR